MNSIIDGSMMLGDVEKGPYFDHVKQARKILNSYNDSELEDVWSELCALFGEWIYKESPFKNMPFGLGDVNAPKHVYTVPTRVPSEYRLVSDLLMLIYIGFTYQPMWKFVERHSLTSLISLIVLYYSREGRLKEVDRAVILMIWLDKGRVKKLLSLEEQRKLRDSGKIYDARIACLSEWLDLKERSLKVNNLTLNRLALDYTQREMSEMLHADYPTIFSPYSKHTFAKFWKKQNLCQLRGGRRKGGIKKDPH